MPTVHQQVRLSIPLLQGGRQENTTCYVSTAYIDMGYPYADDVVHEAVRAREFYSRKTILASCLLACWLVVAGHVAAQEFPLPEFDVARAKASYVVSLPNNYSAEKKWPLIVDFHGAIAPSRKGANVTQRHVWSEFVKNAPFVVVGINGRTRAWNMTRGDKGDRAYTLRVLAEVRDKFAIDPARVYLAGFSSGADYLCSGGLQLEGLFAASLVVCPGPPNVVGLRDGSLLKGKVHPFYFATGEEDFIRKSGAWEAFLALDGADGADVMYRQVPGDGHSYFGTRDYVRLRDSLERMASDIDGKLGPTASDAIARGDYLLASTHLLRSKDADARKQLAELRAKGELLAEEAARIDSKQNPGRAFEAWWKVRTQFHRFAPLARRAQDELDRIKKSVSGRELLRARGAWFKTRGEGGAPRPKAPAEAQVTPAEDGEARLPIAAPTHNPDGAGR